MWATKNAVIIQEKETEAHGWSEADAHSCYKEIRLLRLEASATWSQLNQMLHTAATEVVQLLLAVESDTAHCFGVVARGSLSGVMKARREEVVAVTVPTRVSDCCFLAGIGCWWCSRVVY
ncbi:hypothetical protein H0E87_021050 [Populus deltoides]|uniref:Uncharacterized protein n=1 Tax=Populus deltoides TaxID=3696 RepID=A0A8T2XLV7_POPDE|nr:hypothetical protein H0E87_021047 [Populus deltoides]KAH8494509.1 hypothetical protein H0E87_021050 [Populus deltoides]